MVKCSWCGAEVEASEGLNDYNSCEDCHFHILQLGGIALSHLVSSHRDAVKKLIDADRAFERDCEECDGLILNRDECKCTNKTCPKGHLEFPHETGCKEIAKLGSITHP